MRPFLVTNVEQYASAALAQIKADRIGPGTAGMAFVDLLASTTRCSRIVLTTSGTMALQLALEAVKRKHGPGWVIVPAYGFLATANAAKLAGFDVAVADIGENGCITPDTLLDALRHTPNAKAAIFVNFAGETPDYIAGLRQLCDDNGVMLIEDAACAIGHSMNGKSAGTFGHFGTYSFAPSKLVTTGQGGAVLCEAADDYQFLLEYVNQGDSKRTGKAQIVGGNFRMSDINAALGIAQMRDLSKIMDRRKAQLQNLGPSPFLMKTTSGPILYNMLRVPANAAKSVLRELHELNIHATMQYRTIYESPAFPELADQFPMTGAELFKRTVIYFSHGLGIPLDECGEMGQALRRLENLVGMQ